MQSCTEIQGTWSQFFLSFSFTYTDKLLFSVSVESSLGCNLPTILFFHFISCHIPFDRSDSIIKRVSWSASAERSVRFISLGSSMTSQEIRDEIMYLAHYFLALSSLHIIFMNPMNCLRLTDAPHSKNKMIAPMFPTSSIICWVDTNTHTHKARLVERNPSKAEFSLAFV